MIRVAMQAVDFDVAEAYQTLRLLSADTGAIVSFTGLVRDLHQASLSSLTLEYYPGMTEKSLQAIAENAFRRWPLQGLSIIHRYGKLSVNAQIVFVGVASAHRQAAFDAANYSMDLLKTQAPFWKKETTDHGSQWLDANRSDIESAERWFCDEDT